MTMLRKMFESFSFTSVKKPEVIARRGVDHPKGAKELMRIPLGHPIPPGVILGKGTVITVE